MQTCTKNKQLIEVCKQLRYNQSIIFSSENNLKVPSSITNSNQDADPSDKPHGLWYSAGPSWIEYLTDHYEEPDGDCEWARGRMAQVTHVYNLSINQSRVIGIFDTKLFDRFTKEFGNRKKQIHWRKVAKLASGIYVNCLPERFDVRWYDGWDVGSGVIWKRDAVRRIKLMASWDVNWKRSI